MDTKITKQAIKQFDRSFDQSSANQVAMNAVCKNGIGDNIYAYDYARHNPHQYSISIETGKITNQKKSGRCWMFAALNVMRLEVMKKLNLETFEFSQAYPLFWDKLEKSNYFLENIIQTVEEPLDGRLIGWLLTAPLNDGGQWDMFCGLVNKYGVVPKEAMPESFTSSETHQMNKYLTLKLREFAAVLRNHYQKNKDLDQLRQIKQQQLDTIYRMLCISLGKPPTEFNFEIRDKNHQFIRRNNITPQQFYQEYVDLNLSDYVSLIHSPTDDKPFDKTYTVSYLGSVIEGPAIKYLNLPIEALKKAAIKSMKDGNVVWFGSDVGQFSLSKEGIMDTASVAADSLFSTEFPMTKAERLDYGESLMTHAMVLTGVNLNDQNKPTHWQVENSWGKEKGKDGFYVMTDRWFDEYTYQVVVHKKYLTAAQRKLLEQKPMPLNPWDPMGSLAITIG